MNKMVSKRNIQLSVFNLEKAIPFYEVIMKYLGFETIIKFPIGLYMTSRERNFVLSARTRENYELELVSTKGTRAFFQIFVNSQVEIDRFDSFLRCQNMHISSTALTVYDEYDAYKSTVVDFEGNTFELVCSK